MSEAKTKVVFACPTITEPCRQFRDAMEASVPVLDAAGVQHEMTVEVGCPYISAARAVMLRKALDAKADVIVFLDHDLSWDPQDLLTLLNTDGDVVAGTYRFKIDEEKYMSTIHCDAAGRPLLRAADGAIKAERVPAGFLKITKEAVGRFMAAYPGLVFGPRYSPSVDLFNHGAHPNGIDFHPSHGDWWGEDYAFSRNWCAAGGAIWLVPNLNITHHGSDKDGSDKPFPGNFHEFLLRQPQPEES